MEVETFAPGRVELLGNHTDYNGGVVLASALDLGTTARGRKGTDARFVLRSEGLEAVEVSVAERTGTWADYPLGVYRAMQEAGLPVGPFEAAYTSTLPTGAGLSSSAAIEVATAMLLCRVFGFALPALELAKLCRRAENEFVGVNCGLLDQAASVFGKAGHAVYLDFRTETVEAVPMPAGAGLLVVNSGVHHALTGGEYNERREACFEAARILGVPALRDATEAALAAAAMPEVVRRRAAHIVGENARVGAGTLCLRAGDAAGFGSLMNASHQSSIHNFENSTPELDALEAIARAQPGIYGARLTGGGFGGAIVALGSTDALESAAAAIVERYGSETGHRATPIVCQPGDGAFARAGWELSPRAHLREL